METQIPAKYSSYHRSGHSNQHSSRELGGARWGETKRTRTARKISSFVMKANNETHNGTSQAKTVPPVREEQAFLEQGQQSSISKLFRNMVKGAGVV